MSELVGMQRIKDGVKQRLVEQKHVYSCGKLSVGSIWKDVNHPFLEHPMEWEEKV